MVRHPELPVVALGVVAVAVAVGAAFVTAGAAASNPGEPVSFYGTATATDGTQATAGTVIVAAVDGTEVDRITVEKRGVYAGDGPTDEKLRTHTGAGDTVTFHVGDIDGPQAAESYEIGASGVVELDLTFPAGTFTETPDDTQPESNGTQPSGGSGGTTDSENRITVEVTLEDEITTGADGEGTVSSGSVAVTAAANSTIELGIVEGNTTTAGSDQTATAGLVATIESIAIDVVADVEASFDITQSAGPPSEDAAAFDTDDGTEPVGFVRIETSLEDEQIAGATFEFRMSRAALDGAGVPPEDVAMYHFDEDAGVWEELPTAVVDETAGVVRFRAETTGFSQFAVGLKRAQFELVEATVDGRAFTPGDTVEVEVTVANTGGADGTFGLNLGVGDEVVERTELPVASDAVEVTRLAYVPADPGTYQILVNGLAIDEIEVGSLEDNPTDGGQESDPPTDDGREKNPIPDDAQQSVGGEDGDAEDASAGSDGPSGVVVGVIVAIVVVVVLEASIYVWRRR